MQDRRADGASTLGLTSPDLSDSSDWLTRGEFARMARISVVTATRWASKGIGPTAHRIGPRLVRYRRSEVEAWMQGELHTTPSR